jgi:hypothetical protein
MDIPNAIFDFGAGRWIEYSSDSSGAESSFTGAASAFAGEGGCSQKSTPFW